MSKQVVSVRISAQTLADIYNFLHDACNYNVHNLPVSKAVNMSLDNMMRWVRQSIDLPTYDSEEDALKIVNKYLGRVPANYVEQSKMPNINLDMKEIEERTVSHLEETHELITQNMGDNYIPQETKTREEIAEEKEQVAKKKESLVGLIDTFREKVEKEESDALISAIKTDSIYKKEE